MKPIIFNGEMVRAILDGRKTQTRRSCKDQTAEKYLNVKGMPTIPEGKLYTGWVKEYRDKALMVPTKCPYGKVGDRLWVRETWSKLSEIGGEIKENCLYRADSSAPELFKWKPSIHMPRWASRITLEITDIRVERLHCGYGFYYQEEGFPKQYATEGQVQRWFKDLWQSIYGTWDENPWVWVIEFKQVEPKEDGK